jgi:hypothetical protein
MDMCIVGSLAAARSRRLVGGGALAARVCVLRKRKT